MAWKILKSSSVTWLDHQYDHSIFFKRIECGVEILVIHVDDIVITKGEQKGFGTLIRHFCANFCTISESDK